MILRPPVDAITPRSMRTVVATNPKSPDTPKCDVAACTRARPRSLRRVARLWRPPSRIGRKLPGRPRFSSQANVAFSCEHREQARRPKGAVRSVGVRQLQCSVRRCFRSRMRSKFDVHHVQWTRGPQACGRCSMCRCAIPSRDDTRRSAGVASQKCSISGAAALSGGQ